MHIILRRSLAAFLVLFVAAPVLAHPRTIESMDGGLDGNKLEIFAYLNKRHPGKMFITLYTDDNGDWEFVDRKRADKISPRGFRARFPNPPGDEQCKVRASFKADGHDSPHESGQLPC